MAIDIPHTASYNLNCRKVKDGQMPCAVCGKGITMEGHRLWVHIHGGGGELVTETEANERNRDGGENADLYFHPIGRDCLRSHPELRPYVTDVPEDSDPDAVEVGPGDWRVL